jgi:N-acetylmuramic acid 6-phosphate etherase
MTFAPIGQDRDRKRNSKAPANHMHVSHDRGRLTTETRNERSAHFDRLSILEAVEVMNQEDATIAAAVAAAKSEIARAIEFVVRAFQSGGRLIYVGAGTSGRLGVLDAAECPPTFLTSPDMVQGIIAGGPDALTRSIEGAEDSESAGAAAMDQRNIDDRDVVFAIATGGTTPFVHGAITQARAAGARTVFLACVPKELVSDEADVSIRIITGPEVITGSTRLKAGTATKMVLNTVTTVAMTQIGKVHGNLMVDVNTGANAKLLDRGIRIVQETTRLSRDESQALLTRAAGRVKIALVMHARGLTPQDADAWLNENNGRIGDILPSA